jgi:hypothetical protein
VGQGVRIYIEGLIGIASAIGIENSGYFESDSDSEDKITGKIIAAFILFLWKKQKARRLTWGEERLWLHVSI